MLLSGEATYRVSGAIAGPSGIRMAHPVDVTTGRSFLDWPEEGDGESIRSLLAYLVVEFAAYCTGRPAAASA